MRRFALQPTWYQLGTNLVPTCDQIARKMHFNPVFAKNSQIIELKCAENHFSDETGNVQQTHVAFFHAKLARRGVKHGERSTFQ
jgi:hypothetical protein